MQEQEQKLIRIFFKNGRVETRPIDRVHFYLPDTITEQDLQSFLQMQQSVSERDRLLVNGDDIQMLQVFRGVFRERNRSDDRDDSNWRDGKRRDQGSRQASA